jgi:hypothetical protein
MNGCNSNFEHQGLMWMDTIFALITLILRVLAVAESLNLG